ncbi:glycosyltransferase [Protaetiibacter sp. SSC-01]|uniref:glycosyltransferase n=1 Tax=Protaetiibacter sp. SSC-01 TaxID=2759943 RepID=UPI00165752B0|nr:glycosyltransferase [Protaetiibacter sp. SSC-01]QNO37042.1 glycosyltransferase [Protaetiibacter sp. SSC-01]
MTAVLNLHRELRLAYPTLRSIERAIRAAEGELAVDVLIVLDRPDPATEEYIRDAAPRVLGDIPHDIVVVDNGDLGLSRNDGVRLARGEFVAMCDGDNMVSLDWFRNAVAFVAAHEEPVVAHPEYIVSFDALDVLWKIVSSRDPQFDALALAEDNLWDATCIARRQTFVDVPYIATYAQTGTGPEDWQWNAETLAKGIDHLPVPGTSLFYRIKRVGSLLARHVAGAAMLPHSVYFADRSIPEGINARNRGALVGSAEPASRPGVGARVKGLGRRAVVQVAKTGFRAVRRVVGGHPQFPMVQEELRELVWRVNNARGGAPWGDIPDQLREEWRAMHRIEPHVFPEKRTLARMQYYAPQRSVFTDVYWQLVDSVGATPDYLFVVPWLRRGGADKVILNYVRAILEADTDARIVVLGTEPGESEWASRLPAEVSFVQVPEAFHGMQPERQDRVLGLAMTQLAPRIIHLVNSNVGYRVYTKNSAALAQRSRLFLSVFCIDETEEGRLTHYMLKGLRQYMEHVDAVFTDNADIVRFLRETYDYPEREFAVHYQPVDPPELEPRAREVRPFTADEPLRVLWAARFDRQKRLDVLLDVARIASERGLPVEFHVFGSAGIEVDSAAREVTRSSHVRYRGAFDGGLEVLEPDRYDVIMLTSQWEGLPNTILEAATYELPALAPRVGGVAEFVGPATGYIVERFDDAAAYVDQIASMVGDPEGVRSRGRAARELVDERHSWTAFARTVRERDSYTV